MLIYWVFTFALFVFRVLVFLWGRTGRAPSILYGGGRHTLSTQILWGGVGVRGGGRDSNLLHQSCHGDYRRE